MKRLVVTGATSFVGRQALPALAREYELVCLVRDRARLAGLTSVEAVEGDLAQPGFSRALPSRADGILHMAVAAPSLAPEPAYAFQVNAASALELLEWGKAAGIERFLFTSSGSVYAPQPTPIGEDVAPRPADLLGVAKWSAEMLAGLYASLFSVVILRLWRPYGPGHPANLLIPRLAARIRAGETIIVNRGGHPRANEMYIDDVVEALVHALHLDRSVTLNVAHPAAHSILELCRELEALVGRPAVIQESDREAGDLVADVRRMEQVLGFRAETSLHDGLRRTFGAEAWGTRS